MLYRSLRVAVTDWGNQRGRIIFPTGFAPSGAPLCAVGSSSFPSPGIRCQFNDKLTFHRTGRKR